MQRYKQQTSKIDPNVQLKRYLNDYFQSLPDDEGEDLYADYPGQTFNWRCRLANRGSIETVYTARVSDNDYERSFDLSLSGFSDDAKSEIVDKFNEGVTLCFEFVFNALNDVNPDDVTEVENYIYSELGINFIVDDYISNGVNEIDRHNINRVKIDLFINVVNRKFSDDLVYIDNVTGEVVSKVLIVDNLDELENLSFDVVNDDDFSLLDEEFEVNLVEYGEYHIYAAKRVPGFSRDTVGSADSAITEFVTGEEASDSSRLAISFFELRGEKDLYTGIAKTVYVFRCWGSPEPDARRLWMLLDRALHDYERVYFSDMYVYSSFRRDMPELDLSDEKKVYNAFNYYCAYDLMYWEYDERRVLK